VCEELAGQGAESDNAETRAEHPELGVYVKAADRRSSARLNLQSRAVGDAECSMCRDGPCLGPGVCGEVPGVGEHELVPAPFRRQGNTTRWVGDRVAPNPGSAPGLPCPEIDMIGLSVGGLSRAHLAMIGPMTPQLTHFAINTTDVDDTRAFYESVFDWQFREYGPPGFVQIMDEGGQSPMGAIQQRRQLLDSEPTRGFECTFGVDDVEEVRRRVVAAGAGS